MRVKVPEDIETRIFNGRIGPDFARRAMALPDGALFRGGEIPET